jgi:hypothetical protein
MADSCDDIRCIQHDKNRHWEDDMKYVDPLNIDDIPPEQIPSWDMMVQKITEAKPDDTGGIYRFALVIVDQKTGLMDVLGSPGQDPLRVINLLSRAVSIIAYTEDVNAERNMSSTLATALKVYRDMLSGDEIPVTDNINPISGQYL